MPADTERVATAALEERIRDRLGVLPNFFRLTPAAPDVTRDLWGFAESAYLDNPLPALFKERLFVYLSQFCEVRYCIARHVGFLTGRGRPSGDRDVTPETAEQVVQLLRRPLLQGVALDRLIKANLERSAPLKRIPDPGTDAEEAIFACASHVFQQDEDSARSLQALHEGLDDADLQYLLAFLAFVRTAHFWSKTHPELSLEQDITELLGVHEALNACIVGGPESVAGDAVRVLQRELEDLRREEADLQSRVGQSRFLASIIESSEDAIYSKTLQGIIQSWNRSAERMFGFTEERAVGQHVFMLIPPELYSQEEETLAQVAIGKRVNHFDTERLDASGKRIAVALTVSPIKDEVGNIIAASTIARDISAQKSAAQALLESEERVRSALEGAELGAWNIINSDTMELQTDQRFKEIFGGQVADATSFRKVMDIIHPDDRQRVQGAVEAAIDPEQPKPYEIEYRVVWPDGSVRWVYAKGKPRFAKTNGVRCLVSFDGTVMDITEQRTLREELRDAAERLSEADRRKDEFLATLAHELRNPLAPIRTGLDALRLAADDPVARERTLTIMVRQTEQIVHLVDDLLDVSRITRGSLQLRRSRIDLLAVVRSAIESTRTLMVEAGHELRVMLPDDPVYLHADPTRLSQVLSNLLNNAGKYTDPGGQVRLTVEAASDEVVISVSDNGRGIQPGMEAKIFELFGQVSRSADDELQSGLGIGLTLVRRLVEMHGGTVEVQSDGIGKGSTFTVQLPREGSGSDSPRYEPTARQSATLRVLVVDDNREAAETMAMLVELFGNDVRTANDGDEAVRLAGEFLPDVVFMDIGMPRMDGNEAARRIRKESWGQAMKLVALTGWGQEHQKLRTKESGFDAHLVKPANTETIKALLAEYSHGH